MKKSFYSILLLFLTILPLTAQEWQTDFDTAKEIASKENRPIVLVFQGSDWCAPCIKLDKQVFSTETFQLYAKDHFVMLEADFPKKKKNALPQAICDIRVRSCSEDSCGAEDVLCYRKQVRLAT